MKHILGFIFCFNCLGVCAQTVSEKSNNWLEISCDTIGNLVGSPVPAAVRVVKFERKMTAKDGSGRTFYVCKDKEIESVIISHDSMLLDIQYHEKEIDLFELFIKLN